jgi:hypothetical protein
MMKEIKCINVLSAAKICGLSSAILGLVIGIFVGLVMFFVGSFLNTGSNYSSILGPGLGIAGFIIMPLITGLLGFAFGAFTALIYNTLSSWVGGIKIEIEESENADR